jgi:serine/threonine protein kinase
MRPSDADHPPPGLARADEVDDLLHRLHRMESLTDQTAVHRKKFEFALSQLRKFFQRSGERALPDPPTAAQSAAAAALRAHFQALRALIIANLLQNWSTPTIENPADWVLDQLRDIFAGIKRAAAAWDADASAEIHPQGAQWAQYHVLDLRAIHASFMQYLRARDVDARLARSIETRLISINRHLAAEASVNENFANRTFSPIPVNYHAWRVDAADFEQLKQIGGGVSALVYFGRSRATGADVAIKKFKFAKLNGARLQSFQREVACLATASHPAVLKLIGATDTPPFCIITEWMPNSSLFHDLHQFHRLDATGRTIAAFDIARGMQFLHACHIVHRDLKSLNILLDANYRIRICDFGFSRYASDDAPMTQNLGTPHWMAPEVLAKGSNYTAKVDVYAFGIVLWELATGDTPYSGMDSATITREVQHRDLRPSLPPDLYPAMADLITQCWDRNPAVRPTFDEIVRRFESEKVIFKGTNRDDFLRYIHDTATTGELLSREVGYAIRRVVDGEATLSEATKKLASTGIPPDMLETCWTSLVDILPRFSPADVSTYLLLFVKSSRVRDCVALLRAMGRRQVPADAITAFVSEIPTGSEELDTEIAVTACRNGCADLCALYATRSSDIALALEIVAKLGVDLQLRPAVVDRCIQSLGTADAALAAAALKCLLSLRELKRVNFNRLALFMGSPNRSLSSAAYLAAAAMATDGLFPPADLFEMLLRTIGDDRRARLVVITACRDFALAGRLVAACEGGAVAGEGALRALACAARHAELRARIAAIVEAGNFTEHPRIGRGATALLDKCRPRAASGE